MGVVFRPDSHREKVDKGRAEILFKSLVKGLEEGAVSEIVLGGKALLPEAAQWIVDHAMGLDVELEGSSTLKELTRVVSLADIIAGLGEEEALQTFRVLSSGLTKSPRVIVEHLDLSDNAMGEKGVRAFEDLLVSSRESLRSLMMSNNGLSAEALAVLSEFLVGTSESTQLERLHMPNNMLGENAAAQLVRILKVSPNLQDICLASTRIPSDGMTEIAKALLATKKLRRIDFGDLSFENPNAILALRELLNDQKNLEFLGLRDAGVGDKGVSCIIQSLAHLRDSLKQLDLAGNDISAKGAKLVAILVQFSRGLEILCLDENLLCTSGAKAISQAIAESMDCSLTEISLAKCEIGPSGVSAIAKAVYSLESITKVDLSGNAIPKSCVEEMGAILGKALVVRDDEDDIDEDEVDEDNEEDEDEDEGEDEDDEADEIEGMLDIDGLVELYQNQARV
uniref:Uncharacterized protein n=1 Tax=Compsopogon caeruleus TaxID=31354 RepID=A0A7S1TK64_9RHOD|mmetsp:Transcript_990/g.2118  ORF Transcript_990/g.2118 Transcript_990/m.2118 type:complete len:453 (+) Transcript_990:103-1461(+)